MMTNEKRTLREALFNRRLSISAIGHAELSARACSTLLGLPEYADAKTILCYSSIKNELETRGFIRQAMIDKKRVCLPSLRADSIVAVALTEESELVPGKFGTREIASGDEVSPEEIDLVVVPGLGFDLQGGRIGYGKGYYDRYLKDLRCLKVGLTFHDLIVDSVPCTANDVRMDVIVTNQGLYIANRNKGEIL